MKIGASVFLEVDDAEIRRLHCLFPKWRLIFGRPQTSLCIMSHLYMCFNGRSLTYKEVGRRILARDSCSSRAQGSLRLSGDSHWGFASCLDSPHCGRQGMTGQKVP